MIIILLGHTAGLFAFAVATGRAPTSALLYVSPVGLAAALAAAPSLGRRFRSCLATAGAMASSAVLVQLTGGLIEAHFHFFVMLSVITIYQDWLTFLLAAGFAAVEHAVVGVLAPEAVYAHSDAQHHPVKWALIHAMFITGAAAAAVANWRLTENAQAGERQIAARLAYEAGHDPLTGALNRREFDRQLALLLGRPRPEHSGPDGYDALCYLDLDRFKIVNDSCGHAAGDLVLVQITDLIRGQMGEHDLLARVGGDEFVVLLLDCELTRAADFAERARTAVAEHRFTIGNRVFDVGMSVGVVPVTSVTSAQEAVRAADAACYAAKDRGRNRIHVVSPEDSELTRQRGEVRWAEKLMSAIQDDSLQLYYQPIAPTRATPGAERFGELLLRMRDEDGLIIGPGPFLAAAERYNLLTAVDRWVVGAALGALEGRYQGVRVRDRHELFSINLSGSSIGDETFLAYVRSQFAERGVPPEVICFEITETVAITDLSAAVAFITELRALGCRFALDDFGSGLSSFTYLKKLPVDFVKIDGNFVREITSDPVDRAMVESVNRISHEMGLRTVAEFVETDAIMQTLRALGVDYAQGFGVARPEAFAGWLRRAPGGQYPAPGDGRPGGLANVSRLTPYAGKSAGQRQPPRRCPSPPAGGHPPATRSPGSKPRATRSSPSAAPSTRHELIERIAGRAPARHPVQDPGHRRRCSAAAPACWRSARSASAPTRSTWPRPPAAGIAVFNAPFSNTRSVVELALAEIIALTRRLTEKNAGMHDGRLGQGGRRQPRGPRPHAGHRRLRQHRHPAVGARREPRHARLLLRHRRQARARQRPALRHARRAARGRRRRDPARRRPARQQRLLRRGAVRPDAAGQPVPQPVPRLRHRPRRAARAPGQRPPRRRRGRRLPERAEGPRRRVRAPRCAGCPT